MCDYSLEAYSSRPAREAETYVTTRFATGSLGVTAPGDPTTAICLQADAELRLENLPAHIQDAYDVRESEHAVFVRLEPGPYRDGVRFDNAREVSLQLLGPGVRVMLTPQPAHIPALALATSA